MRESQGSGTKCLGGTLRTNEAVEVGEIESGDLRKVPGRPDRHGFLRYFKDRLVTWGVDRDGHLAVKLRDSPFDTISIRIRAILFGEHEVMLTGRRTMVPRERMSEREKRAYVRLKRAEFDVEWRGLLRRRYFCASSPSLEVLSKLLSERGMAPLNQDAGLCQEILSNEEIGRVLVDLRPEAVRAYLHTGYAPSGASPKEIEAEMLDFFQDPEELRWEIEVTKLVAMAAIDPHDVRLMLLILEKTIEKVIAYTNDCLR